MAHAAYCDQKYLEELFEKYGAKVEFYKSKPDKNGIIRGREAFLAIWDDKAILSFRGTEADDTTKIKISTKYISAAKKYLGIDIPAEIDTLFPTDLFDDAAFAEHPYKGAKVHGGFFRATEELWPRISKDLDNLKAMAVIAAMMRSAEKHSFKEVVTFGEPGVGNDIEGALCKCSHIRFVNGDDPVTKIVPEKLYTHHSDPIEIKDISGPDIRFDHSIVNYAEILGERRYSRHMR
jgi:hypothetical protein